jgi:hypothetical protein
MTAEQESGAPDVNFNATNIIIWKPGANAGSIEDIERMLDDAMDRSYTTEDVKGILGTREVKAYKAYFFATNYI